MRSSSVTGVILEPTRRVHKRAAACKAPFAKAAAQRKVCTGHPKLRSRAEVSALGQTHRHIRLLGAHTVVEAGPSRSSSFSSPREKARRDAYIRGSSFLGLLLQLYVLRLPTPALKTRINGWQEASSAFPFPVARWTASAQVPLPERPTRTSSRRHVHLSLCRCSYGGRRGR